MTSVWQTFIPETPSTEPIAAPHEEDDDLTAVITSPSSQYLQVPNHTSHRLSSGTTSTTCSSSSPYHRNASQALLHHHHHHNNNTSGYKGSSSSSSDGFNRIASPSNNSNNNGRLSRLGSFLSRFWWWSDNSRHHHRGRESDTKSRLFLKGGQWNTHQVNVFRKGSSYFKDIFTTLVDAQWRWTLFVFSFSYLMSWITFAILWWIILIVHGDIENFGKEGWIPCVMEVGTFTSVFLFSVETQHTIGYGHHRMTDSCHEAIVILCLQSIAGVLIEAFMVGVVFAKLSRPKKRSETLAFSRNAVICQRNGELYLMFRVGDLRNKSHILEAHVRSQVITKKVTEEGEVIPIHQEEIKVGGYGEDEDRILLFWPTLILHPIDADSPFYSMSPNDLLKAKLEVLVVMEGVVESTGMTTQARTSYLPSEILWGHRFHNLASYKTDIGQHVFDFDLFNSTFPVDTPLCSARDLDQLRSLKVEDMAGGESQERELLASSSSFNNNNNGNESNSMSIHVDRVSDINNHNHSCNCHMRSSSTSLNSLHLQSRHQNHRHQHYHHHYNRRRSSNSLLNSQNHCCAQSDNNINNGNRCKRKSSQPNISSNIELSLINVLNTNNNNNNSNSIERDDDDREGHHHEPDDNDTETQNTSFLSTANERAPLVCNNVDDDDDEEEELMIHEQDLFQSDNESLNNVNFNHDHNKGIDDESVESEHNNGREPAAALALTSRLTKNKLNEQNKLSNLVNNNNSSVIQPSPISGGDGARRRHSLQNSCESINSDSIV